MDLSIDLLKLKPQSRCQTPLEQAMRQAAFEGELEDRLEAFKAELKSFGFTHVWIAKCPLWPNFHGQDFIFGAPPPKNKYDGVDSSKFWRIKDKYFGAGCGNGRNKVTQAQCNISWPGRFHGEHIL